jgi:hypothetical protein
MKTKYLNGKFITTTSSQENTIEGIFYGFNNFPGSILVSMGRQFNQDTGNIEVWVYKGFSSATVLFHALIDRQGKFIQ